MPGLIRSWRLCPVSIWLRMAGRIPGYNVEPSGAAVNTDWLILLAARLGCIATGVVLCLSAVGAVHLH